MEAMSMTLIWSKILSPTDAQRQDGHITGDLRLTKAGYDIDQLTYFRRQIFQNLTWTPDAQGHEQAVAPFHVVILGADLGVIDMTLSYRPLGHSDQRNYTTGLRWGDLRDRLQTRVDVTGKEVRIYATANGTGAVPFRLEIV